MINFNDSFNWLGVLKDLKAGMPISFEEKRRLSHLASCWPTCACSQLCKGLPRYSRRAELEGSDYYLAGAPKDNELRNLGTFFYQWVDRGDWGEALKTFHLIEARTREVLGQLEE